jgi:hypothetical protein
MLNRAPRRDTSAAKALITLDGAGGKLALTQWRASIFWKGSLKDFDLRVVDRLIQAGFVRTTLADASITAAGRAFAHPKNVGLVQEPGPLAGAPYVAPVRPLDLGRYRPPQVRRPGSMDYRNYPSLCGGERVPYGTET